MARRKRWNSDPEGFPTDVDIGIREVRRKAGLCEFCGGQGLLKGCKPCRNYAVVTCGYHAVKHLQEKHGFVPDWEIGK